MSDDDTLEDEIYHDGLVDGFSSGFQRALDLFASSANEIGLKLTDKQISALKEALLNGQPQQKKGAR